MLDPVMQSPLHSFDLACQARAIDDGCGVWANEAPYFGYISLRGDATDPAFVNATATALGFALPLQPCTLAASDNLKVLWLAPDEWMIVCASQQRLSLINKLAQALQNIRSQVVDNSGGYSQIVLLGRNALDVLQHTSVYDFAALEPGRVVGSTFGKASVFAHRRGDGYCLILRRSFADYIWRYLARAAQPYGLGIALLDAGHRSGQEVAS